MKLQYEDFRKHFEALSDEALLEVDRNDLVEAAQQAYDEQISIRELEAPLKHTEMRPWAPEDSDFGDQDDNAALEPEPDWLESAFCALSWTMLPGKAYADEAADARTALHGAGILSELSQRDPEKEGESPVLELLVPAKLSLQAVSVLDKEVFNPQMVADWRTHFESLSDEDLRSVDPSLLIAGLLDRAARLKQTYEEEVARRRAAQA
jgi:hypothetical protein